VRTLEHAHSGSIDEQHLDRRAPPPEEHEERPRSRGAAEPLGDNPTQPIKPPPEVDRLERHEDLDAAWDHRLDFGASRSSTSATRSRSAPALTPNAVRVTPHVAATRREREAIAALLTTVNARGLRLPGDAKGRNLVFRSQL
jgi:hypothetical protein